MGKNAKRAVLFLSCAVLPLPAGSAALARGMNPLPPDDPRANSRTTSLSDNWQIRWPTCVAVHQPSTTISYSLSAAGEVQIEVFNLLGQKVRVLVDGFRPAGTYETEWDGRTDSGAVAASGVYFYRLATTELRVSRKMLLVK